MTELLTRPRPTQGRAPDQPAVPVGSLWWRGVLGAAWAVAVGVASLVVIVLLIWATDSRASVGAGPAVRGALQAWLVAQHVAVHVQGASIGIPPLLLTAALVALLAHASASLARAHEVTDGTGIARVTLAVGLPYAALASFVAAAATSAQVRPRPVAALLAGVVVGCAASAWGAARGTGAWRIVWERWPEDVRTVARATGLALGVVAGVATAIVLGAVALHGAAVVHGISALGGGGVAYAALVLLDLAFLPNAFVWAMSYLVGPGFAIAGGVVSLRSGAPANVPALPLLQILPSAPAPAFVAAVAILTVVGAGGAAGWLVARAGHALTRSAGLAAAAGAAAGVCAAVLTAMAGGPAGPGRMAAVGASPWQVGLLFGLEVVVVGTGTACALTWRRGR